MRPGINPDKPTLVSLIARLRASDFAGSVLAIAASFIGAASVHAADSPAADTPAPDMPPDLVSSDSAAHSKFADALTADHGSPFDAAPSTDANGGDGTGHVLASDGSFWFDANDGSVTDVPVSGNGSHFDIEGVAPVLGDASTNDFGHATEAAFTSANSSAFQYGGAPSIAVSDLHGAPSSHADPVGGNVATTPIVNIAANVPVFSDTTSNVTPAGSAPMLAWIGDLGSGSTNGAGAGSPDHHHHRRRLWRNRRPVAGFGRSW